MTPRTQRRTSSLLSFLAVLSIGLCGVSRMAVAEAESTRTPPRTLRGQSALDALGARLPEVANAHGLSAERLRDLLTHDRTLHLTEDLDLLYVDTGLSGSSAPTLPDPSAIAGTLAAPESTFFLHSRPGAKHTIYLDFDGHVTRDTRWNGQYDIETIVSPPFDTNGDPTTFTTAELTLIQQAWDGVAEDFRPFDVNVTTQDPGVEALRRVGGGDVAWGIRVVITEDFTGGGCQCGGMAYLGFFSASTDTPVFVFNTLLADVTDAISHEVGHSLRLNHDGGGGQEYYAGHGVPDGTSWGSIMGGCYQRLLTQWSKGEYYGATNVEDDLSIITTMNGFGYRPDDHSNSSTDATALTVSDAGGGRLAANGAGIIGMSGDVDCFTFVSGPGSIDLTLRSDPPSARYYAVHRPNLKVAARLYASDGTLITGATGVQTVSLSATLPGGRYSLVVSGAGAGSPFVPPASGYSRYGSLGSYDIAGSFPGAPCPVVDGIDPATGPVGAKIAITGADLAWVRAVTFSGGVPALFKLESPTRIAATIPAGALSGPLTLTNDAYCANTLTKPMTICPSAPELVGEDDALASCVSTVGVDGPGMEGVAFRIAPNPMHEESTIRFALPAPGVCTVRILDPAGRLVRQLQSGWTPAGPRQLHWDGRDRNGARVNAGVYFIAVDGAGVRERGSVVMLR